MAKSKSKNNKKKTKKNSNYKNEVLQPKVPPKKKNGKVLTEKQIQKAKLKEEKTKKKLEIKKLKDIKDKENSSNNNKKNELNDNAKKNKNNSKLSKKVPSNKTSEKEKANNNNLFFIENDKQALMREKSIIIGKVEPKDNAAQETIRDTEKYVEEINKFSQIAKINNTESTSEDNFQKERENFQDNINEDIEVNKPIEIFEIDNAEFSDDIAPETFDNDEVNENNVTEDISENIDKVESEISDKIISENIDKPITFDDNTKEIKSDEIIEYSKSNSEIVKEDKKLSNKNKIEKSTIKTQKTEKHTAIIKNKEVKEKVISKSIKKKEKKGEDKLKLTKNISKLFKKNLKLSIITLSVVVVAIVTVLVFSTGIISIGDKNKNEIRYAGRNEPIGAVSNITTSDADQKKLVKETKAKGKTSKFDFFANTTINLSDKKAALPITLGNPTYNDCVLIAYVVDENGEKVYHSLGIEKGKYISTIFIKNGLKYGENKLTLYVTAFGTDGGKDGKSFKKIGTQHTELTVNVSGGDYDSSMLTTQANN